MQRKAEQIKKETELSKLKIEEQEKIKQAKLRAINLKCKDILKNTKKYDPNI